MRDRFLSGIVLAGLFLGLTPSAQTSTPPSEPLVAASGLTYVGAFRLAGEPISDQGCADPNPNDGGANFCSWDYVGYNGGNGLTFDPATQTLVAVGMPYGQRIARINIPVSPSTATTVSQMTQATLASKFADVLGSHRGDIGAGQAQIGGLLPWNGQWVISDYLYYDGGATQVNSHFVVPSLTGTATPAGPYPVQNALGRAGFVSGYMTAIPAEWQPFLGGPYLTGQCCIPIVSRTSYGPSVTAFDPAALASGTLKGVTLLGYPQSHPTLGDWINSGPPNPMFNQATTITAVVLPPGTGSILFFGRTGLGPACYGEGTSESSRAGTLSSDGSRLCYDPTGTTKGTHAYPYAQHVWAYRAADLATVKAGRMKPWDVKPYATWSLTMPGLVSTSTIAGATLDQAGRLYVEVGMTDSGFDPVVYVYTVAAVSTTTPPVVAPVTHPVAGSHASNSARH